MRGLVIKDPWISYILDGRKKWEIRSSKSNIRGEIGLIRSGSGLIVGSAALIDCIGPLSDEEFLANKSKHMVNSLSQVGNYKSVYAWVLSNVKKFDNPIPYNHPQGAIIWVKIPDFSTGPSDPKYDPIIDYYLKSGLALVEVDVPEADNWDLGNELRKRIQFRKLSKIIEVSIVRGKCYLETK